MEQNTEGAATPKLSRQRKWQEARKAKGLCACCGVNPLLTNNYCETCAERIRDKARKRTGAKIRYLKCASYNRPAKKR
jgi:hypothetical protein